VIFDGCKDSISDLLSESLLSKREESGRIKWFVIFIFLFGSAKAQQDFRLQWNFLTSHP